MTKESIILRAYALLSQGKYEEATQMLKSAPEVLNTPSGADLYARLCFEQGLIDEARQIWDHIHEVFPDFESATKALEAFEGLPKEGPPKSTLAFMLKRRPKTLIIGATIISILICLYILNRSYLRQLPDGVTGCATNVTERIVTRTEKHYITNFVDRVQVKFVDRVVTNIVEKRIEIPSRIVLTNIIENVVWKTNQVAAITPNSSSVYTETTAQLKVQEPKVLSATNSPFVTPYIVEEGDTVSALATKYKFRIPDFSVCNPNLDINLIKVGQTILLPCNIKSKVGNED